MPAAKNFVIALLCLLPNAFAALTPDQKASDFTQLAALYSRNYGPYEAKRDLFGFDLYNIQPWLDQVRVSKTDLEFYDICVKYVASLRDSHDEFTIRSTYEAYLPMGVDVYDGKVLIDGIDRKLLPSAAYPFQVGDELLSLDGKSMQDWIKELDPYTVNGASNPVSRARLAANLAIDRYQSWWPTAPVSVGGNTSVMLDIKRQSGDIETYSVSWQILGMAVMGEGGLPSFPTTVAETHRTARTAKLARAVKGDADDNSIDPNPWQLGTLPPDDVPAEVAPEYLAAQRMLTEALPLENENGSISPFGSTFPVFNPPPGLTLRLGLRSSDFFVSGTFPVGTRNVGYIRIPTMSPSNTTAAYSQFVNEMVFLQANTDGLVVDVMGNGGGSGCYAQNLAGALIPHTFRGLAYQIRATEFWLSVFNSSLVNAKLTNAPDYVKILYGEYLKDIVQAFSENRGMTGSLPICGVSFAIPPAQDNSGNVLAYSKPMLVLTDNFTLSAGEIFTMMLQDEGRGPVFGMVTDGGGGNVNSFNAGAYSEGLTRVTQSLITRKAPVAVPGFPAENYYDGVGIYPDIQADYMTKENLMKHGAPFVNAFSAAIAALIDKAQQ